MDEKLCANCGERIKHANFVFCPNCGAPLEEANEPSEEVKKRREAAKAVLEGDGDDPDELYEAIETLTELADGGDLESQLVLGNAYPDILDDEDEALHYYEMAAKQGSARGQYLYWALARENHLDDPEVRAKALHYLALAAEAGDSEAIKDLELIKPAR